MTVDRDERSTGHTGRYRLLLNSLFVLIALAALAYGLGAVLFGFPAIDVVPIYHGAWMLGVSIICAVVLGFSFVGLSRSFSSLEKLEKEEMEVDALVERLDRRFEDFENEFGPLDPEQTQSGGQRELGDIKRRGDDKDNAAE